MGVFNDKKREFAFVDNASVSTSSSVNELAQLNLSGFSLINFDSFGYRFSCVVLVLYLNSTSLRS